MKTEFTRQIFEKSSRIKFNENPSSGSRVIPCGQTDVRTDRHDGAIVASRNFASAPKTIKVSVVAELYATLC